MGRILDALPDHVRDTFQPLAEQASLPLDVPLDRLVANHIEAILDLRRLGASVTAVAQVLAELGVTRDGKPVGAATLSKAISRARVGVAVASVESQPSETTDRPDRGDFVAADSSPHATGISDLRRAAANGGAQRRDVATSGNPRRAEAVRDGKRPKATKRGAARQTAASEGKKRRPKALADGKLRAQAISGGSPQRAINPDDQDAPPRHINAARGTARSQTSGAVRNEC